MESTHFRKKPQLPGPKPLSEFLINVIRSVLEEKYQIDPAEHVSRTMDEAQVSRKQKNRGNRVTPPPPQLPPPPPDQGQHQGNFTPPGPRQQPAASRTPSVRSPSTSSPLNDRTTPSPLHNRNTNTHQRNSPSSSVSISPRRSPIEDRTRAPSPSISPERNPNDNADQPRTRAPSPSPSISPRRNENDDQGRRQRPEDVNNDQPRY